MGTGIHIRRSGLGLMCVGLAALAAPAHAGEWRVTNSIQLNSYLSDNIRHRADGSTGMAVNVRPTIGLRGTGRRIRGALRYAPSLFTAFGDDAPGDRISHNLNAQANLELVRQQLFVDASANAGLISSSGLAGSGDSGFATPDETRQTYSFSVSPYTRHRFGSYADLTARLALDTVQTDSGAGSLDSTGVTASMILASGARFSRFPWSLTTSRNEITYSGRTDTRDNVAARAGYRINRGWRVDGTVGHERYDLEASRTSTSGMTYSGTVFWTPNPRTRAELEVGKRYFGTFLRGRGEHRSKRTLLTLDLQRDVTNARSLFLSRVTDPQRIAQADGDLFVAVGPDGELIFLDLLPNDEDYLNTRVTAAIQVTGRRTRLSAEADWTQRKYEVSPREDELLGLTLRGTRQLGGRISANASIAWRDVQSTSGGDSQFWRLTVGASRQLGRYTRLGLDASRQQRMSDSSASEFTEHRIGVTLTTRMF